jgi:hypothetical protein
VGVTGARTIAKKLRRPAVMFASQTAIALSGLNPKLRLLLLCARIGYTAHASFQR